VTGDDAATFLQGQFTNDLRPLERGARSVYGLWLNAKGKVLADSFVLRDGDGFWVGSYHSPANVIRERLESFVVADDVTIEDGTAQFAGFGLLADDPAAVREVARGGFVFPGRRKRAGSWEWVVRREAAPAATAALAGWRRGEPAELEAWRIEAAIPAVPRDIGPGELPNEGGLDADAISYAKGCYLGQEVMARLKTMGQVRRRLVRVRADLVEAPVTPGPLWIEGRQVGELRSWCRPAGGTGGLGLALVARMHVAQGTRVSREPNGAAEIEIVDTP
jgi:hypothetical protein